ncbi:Rhodanese-like protein [Neocallimastix californiae]|uniref:Rhodanese-like protein n=1 Tax=Neocallimastix californiae TaxID=1754190 RepID=A0A1Y2F464_9FUNG|nr:Rhodanese-like protein [Neocallimastix californiae]|eukprot:ORY78690.1 Rhodanese-like protein [Neocallimastix californiae]
MSNERITCEEYNEILKANKPHILIDVRPQTAFKNGALPNAINIPKAELEENAERIKELLKKKAEEVNENEIPLYLICRSGVTSSLSIPILKKKDINSKDIIGGLLEWKKKIDPDFPI